MLNNEMIAQVSDIGDHFIEQQIVRSVVDYVEQNYASSISLRDVAEALGYSPAYLTHRFSSLTGTPVTALIIKRRVHAAQELLIGTRENVMTVCEAVGFVDLCYFTRQFVRHVGVTPTQFRSASRVCTLKDRAAFGRGSLRAPLG
jgi:AraC-like DNA-binding protein